MKSPAVKNKKPREDGIEAVIRAHDRELRGFLLQRLRGRGPSAEDIRQEIYLRMWRFTDAELLRDPRAYLFRVARNVLKDMLLESRERAIFTSRTEYGNPTGSWRTAVELLARRVALKLSVFPPGHSRRTRGLVSRARTIVRRASAEYERCCDTRRISNSMLEHTLLLAQLEQFYRCGLLSPRFGEISNARLATSAIWWRWREAEA